jgi:hypothetical protein
MVTGTRAQAVRGKAVARLPQSPSGRCAGRRVPGGDLGGHRRSRVFWPVFLVAGWGIGVVMDAWDACWRPQITGHDSQRETERADEQGRPAPPASCRCLPVWRDPAQDRTCGGAREMEELVRL